jgi:hypothetical protein
MTNAHPEFCPRHHPLPCACPLPTADTSYTEQSPRRRVNNIQTAVLSGRYERIRIPNYGRKQKKELDVRRIYFPALFGLSRQKLVGLLDAQIGTATEPDYTLPRQTFLKSPVSLKTQIVELQTALSQTETRAAALKQLIVQSEKLITSWNRVRMKREIKQGTRPPDNLLDKRTIEKFKRDEQKQIAEYKQENRELQKQSKESQLRLSELQSRLDNWGLNPDDSESRFPTHEVPVPFGDEFIVPDQEDFEGKLPKGYDYGVGAYRQMVYQYGNRTDKTIWRGWKKFENEIVLQAIRHGLIRPPKRLLRILPTLTAEPWIDDPEQDDPEHALIVKTGGAQIGGRIYGSNEPGVPERKTFEKYGGRYRPSGSVNIDTDGVED